LHAGYKIVTTKQEGKCLGRKNGKRKARRMSREYGDTALCISYLIKIGWYPSTIFFHMSCLIIVSPSSFSTIFAQYEDF